MASPCHLQKDQSQYNTPRLRNGSILPNKSLILSPTLSLHQPSSTDQTSISIQNKLKLRLPTNLDASLLRRSPRKLKLCPTPDPRHILRTKPRIQFNFSLTLYTRSRRFQKDAIQNFLRNLVKGAGRRISQRFTTIAELPKNQNKLIFLKT